VLKKASKMIIKKEVNRRKRFVLSRHAEKPIREYIFHQAEVGFGNRERGEESGNAIEAGDIKFLPLGRDGRRVQESRSSICDSGGFRCKIAG